MTGQADVVVVGGGHNGLVAAAYLARAGLKTVVCERRGVTGGAAVSEHPFGPDYTVTSLSYVVSLLPPDLVRDLRLNQHGYHVYPQGPYFAPRADGRYLRLPEDPAQRYAEIAKFSAADADAYPGYQDYLAGLGKILGPLLHQIPPRLGSRRPQDLLRQARLLTSLRAVDERAAVDVTRLLTGSIADLLEGYFESDALLGLLSVSGVIGTWAGPRSAGTAYVMLHHHIGETEGQSGAWGFPRGGMGGVSGALARAARMFGAQIRTDAEVAQIRTRDGQVAGVTLARGESIDAPVVVTTAHPQISFLRLLDPAELPADFVADIRGWRSRSGTVKINLALDRLPVFASYPEPDPAVYGGTIVLAESLDDIETAFQQAVSGIPATLPFADICIPSVFDDSLAPAAGSSACRCSPSGCRTPTRTPPTRPGWGPTPTACWPGWRRSRPGSPARCCTGRSSGRTRCRKSTAWSAGTSSTGSCRSGRCSTPGRRPGTPTCARRSAACTRPARPPTAAAASPGSLATTWSGRSWPTDGPNAGASGSPGQVGRDRHAPPKGPPRVNRSLGA